ncbi:MAG: DNA polymerase III subunit alpha [Planctomycetes bacterium]|nr:DNA polymerase III subunit alpha [Planctomycetota bacterium]
MTTKSEFVHLHTHSHYSLLDGACTVDTLIDEAKRQGMPALALTDHGNLFGAIEFYQTALKNGLNPIVGYEAYVAPGSRKDKKITGNTTESAYHLTLLAKNDAGYHNLIKLASSAYLEGFYRKPRIDKEILAQYKNGLIALSGCLHSEINHLVLEDKAESALKAAMQYKDIFGEDFYLEVQQHRISEQLKAINGLMEINQKTGIPLVATNDIHYLRREDRPAHDILLCISTNKKITDPTRMRFSTDEFYFKSVEEMKQLFSEIPESIKNTVAIAGKCNLYLNLKDKHMPSFKPPDNKTSINYIKELCAKGIQMRYPALGAINIDTADAKLPVIHRLREELNIIEKKGLIDYFLVVWDFVRFGKEHKVSIGPGRGSSAGSLLAYVLGITDIDPLKYDLLFERFLNPGRYDPPDIDIDFSQAGRESVINYVKDKYGRENVSQIITFGTMKARAAVRDVGRVMDIPLFEVDRIAKKLGNFMSLKESIKADAELKEAAEKQKRIKELFDISMRLEGLSRHASTHAAGVVIADKPLDNYVPLYSSGGVETTQYTMESLQAIGLLKVDLLGIVTLDIIDRCLELVEQNLAVKININSLPTDDKKTYELLAQSETKGVFQLESAGMRDILQKLKPTKFEDIIAILALYRPGPLQSGLVDNYIRTRHHPSEIGYVDKSLEPLLKETNGIILYQEQVMRIANRIGGFTPSESDDLRKAMGKKIPAIMQEYRDKFVSGAVKNTISKTTAEKIFEMMEYFGGYGFNKSHSTAYAMTSYRTAYLKANYPVEFLAAVMTYNKDDTDKLLEYLEECKRLDIKVIPPDINRSFSDFTVQGNDIIFGLSAVKNVGAKAVGFIVETRTKAGPFKHIYDFCERVDLRHVDKSVIEALIKCGAMDELLKIPSEKKTNRNRLLKGMEQVISITNQHQLDRRQGQMNLLQANNKDASYQYPPLPDEPELPEEEILRYEKESLGFYVSGHPLVKYANMLQELSSLTISHLLTKTPPIEEVKLCGIISQLQTKIAKGQKDGQKMVFFKLRDLSGVVDAVIYSQELQTYRHLIQENKIICLKGKFDSRKGEPIIKVKEAAAIENAYDLMPNFVVIDISLTGLDDDVIYGLRDILLAHPGNCQVILRMKTTENDIAMTKASNNYSVSISPRFREDVIELLGQDVIKFSID